MPSLPKKKTNGATFKKNPGENRITNKLAELEGRLVEEQLKSDEIEIGSDMEIPEERREAGDMADVIKLVAGIKFLVPEWIPYGMVTMILAAPGVGKSAFVLGSLVKSIVTGQDWFNHAKGTGKPGCVLWCDTEGSAGITVQRIRDWGISYDRIKVPFSDDPLRPINLTDTADIKQIELIINEHEIKLVVIDSLRGSHSGDENSSKVVAVLQSLNSIAERTKASIVIIHHTRKLGIDEELSADSSRGSNAIFAMVRSQIGIDQPDKDSDWCRLQMLKENLGLKPNPIGFRVTNTGLEFGPAPIKPRKITQRNKAEDWLKKTMQPGKWYGAKNLRKKAEGDGFSEPALRRARNEIGITKPNCIRKTKEGWQWKLP